MPLREFLLLVLEADVIYVDGDEIWEKQTLRNRSYILSANGIQSLSVPVKHTGGIKVPIKEIQISYDQNWLRVHQGTIFSAYNTSAFFTYFKDDLFAIYDKKPSHLFDLNFQLLQFLLKKFKFKGKLEIYNQQKEVLDLRAYSQLDFLKANAAKGEKYHQVFGYKFEFTKFLSCLDILANSGKI